MKIKNKPRPHLLATLAFYASSPGWQSYKANERNTFRAVMKLAAKGFLELSFDTNQARFTGKTTV